MSLLNHTLLCDHLDNHNDKSNNDILNQKCQRRKNRTKLKQLRQKDHRKKFISVISPFAWLFPEECNICNKTRTKSKGEV